MRMNIIISYFNIYCIIKLFLRNLNNFNILPHYFTIYLIEGDDCISIVSGSKNIRATDIICGPGHGIRFIILLINYFFKI